MKKLCVLCLFAVAAVLAQPKSADAVPAFKKGFAAKYVTKETPKEFATAVKKASCNVCHIKGKKKKVRNQYGLALSKLLKKKDFTSAKVKADPKGKGKAMNEAFAKVEKMKNKEGKTYGALLKAHKLPN